MVKMTDNKEIRGTLKLNLSGLKIYPLKFNANNKPENFNSPEKTSSIKVEPIEYKSNKARGFSNHEDEARLKAVLERRQTPQNTFSYKKKSLSNLIDNNEDESLISEEELVTDNEEDSESEIELALDSNAKEVEKLEGRNDEQYEKESENKLKRRDDEIAQRNDFKEVKEVKEVKEIKKELKQTLRMKMSGGYLKDAIKTSTISSITAVKEVPKKVLEHSSEFVKRGEDSSTFKLINTNVDGVKKYESGLDSKDLLEKRKQTEAIEKEEKERTRIALLKEKKKNTNLRSGLLGLSTDENDIQGEILNKTFVRKKPRQKNRFKSFYEKKIIIQDITIDGLISIRDLSSAMNVKSSEVIKLLNKMEKKRHNDDYMLSPDSAEFLVLEFGHKPILVTVKSINSLILERNKNSNNITEKPPVVTIMGHVDHGKTSLLDALRSSNIVSQESGGITQHIGAYQIVTKSGKKISFIDTPGHEAFTAMRARGSKATDIVILVVAADDGVMPQTIESINHVHSAGVPMIVAVNKIDRTNGESRKILDQLIQYEIVVEECGGEVMSVPISAKNKINLEKLEEAILLQAEMLELRADFDSMASGVVIESKINNTKGSCATLLVQNGTLKIGDCLITNDKFCKVRSMLDEHGKEVKSAEPAVAVEIFGFQKAPEVGQKFIVCSNEKEAKDLLEEFAATEEKQKLIKESEKNKNINILSMIGGISQNNEVKELKFIIKADVSGTIDAVRYSLEKLNSDELKVEVIHSGTGTITESDVSLAKTTGAVIAGFNISVQSNIQNIIGKENITLRIYTIIYQLIDDVADMIKNKLKPQKIEKYIGKLIIKKIFDISKTGKIAGCVVDDGLISTGNFIRVIRKGEVICEELKTSVLKRFKDNVREVKQGMECGVALQSGEKEFTDIMEGDILEIYNIIENK
jgi:translation initiation factor IF-2